MSQIKMYKLSDKRSFFYQPSGRSRISQAKSKGNNHLRLSDLAYWSLWILVMILPLENMVVVEGVGTISRYAGALCMIIAVLAVIFEKRGKPPGATLAIFGVYILWNMTTFFWTLHHEASRRSIVTLIQLFFFVWLIWEFARDETTQNGLMRAYIFGSFISSIITISSFMQGESTYYLRYSTPGFDPNDLGLMLSLAIPMSWYLSIKSDNFIYRQIYRIYLPISFVAILLTASRAAFITMFISYLYIFWSFKAISRLQRLFLWCGLGTLFWGSVQFIPQSSWMRITTIGEQLSTNTLGGRTLIWQDGIKIFMHNPIFGVGTGAFKEGMLKYHGYSASPHNLFLSILVGQGIIGLILFLLVLISVLVEVINLQVLLRRMWFVVLLTWCSGVMTLGWEVRKPTWFIFALIASMGSFYENNPEHIAVEQKTSKS